MLLEHSYYWTVTCSLCHYTLVCGHCSAAKEFGKIRGLQIHRLFTIFFFFFSLQPSSSLIRSLRPWQQHMLPRQVVRGASVLPEMCWTDKANPQQSQNFLFSGTVSIFIIEWLSFSCALFFWHFCFIGCLQGEWKQGKCHATGTQRQIQSQDFQIHFYLNKRRHLDRHFKF